MARLEGEGERVEKRRRRRVFAIVALTGLAGGVVGGTVGGYSGNLLDPNAAMPAWLAMVAAAVTAVATIWGAFAYFRNADELERQVSYWTANITLYFYLIASLAWFLLAKGGVAPEPSFIGMFAATWVVMLVVYAWKKLRP